MDVLSLLCRRSRTADPVVPGTQSLRDTCNLLAQLRGWHRLRIRGDPPRSGSTVERFLQGAISVSLWLVCAAALLLAYNLAAAGSWGWAAVFMLLGIGAGMLGWMAWPLPL